MRAAAARPILTRVLGLAIIVGLTVAGGMAQPVPVVTPDGRGSPERPSVRGLGDVLLIPNTGIDAVMAFDPDTGDLIDPEFIVDPARLNEPVNAILNFDGDGLFVSDRLAHVVHEYDLEGEFVRTFAPAGGPDLDLMRNIRGIRIDPTGTRLWVSVAGTSTHANRGAIVEFDTEGNHVGHFVASDGSPIELPWSILLREDDVLVASSSPNAVYRFELDGTLDGVWNQASVNFPHQLAEAVNGNVLVAGFSSPSGVHEFEPDGSFVALYTPVTGVRGVHELANGNLLVTNADGLHEISRDNTLVRTILTGQMRHIERLGPPRAPPEAHVAPEDVQLAVSPDEPTSTGVVTLANLAGRAPRT